MKVITLKNKSIIKITSVIIFTFVIFNFSKSFAMQHYYKIDFSTGLVTASELNVRSGPGIQYKIIATVKKIIILEFLQEWEIGT